MLARTRPVLNTKLLEELNGTRFLWCRERQNMIPYEVCVKDCQEKCGKFVDYIDLMGVIEDA